MKFDFAEQIKNGTIELPRFRALVDGLRMASWNSGEADELAGMLKQLANDIALAASERWGIRGRCLDLNMYGYRDSLLNESHKWCDGTAEAFLAEHIASEHHPILGIMTSLGKSYFGWEIDPSEVSDTDRVWACVKIAKTLLAEVQRLVPNVTEDPEWMVALPALQDDATFLVCMLNNRPDAVEDFSEDIDEEEDAEHSDDILEMPCNFFPERSDVHLAMERFIESLDRFVRIAGRAIGVLPESVSLQEVC